MGSDPTVAVAVVERVAEEEGTDPTELDQQLSDVVDPDALNELFDAPGDRTTTRRATVSFEFCEYSVTVAGGERVTLTEVAENT